jgi:hypothetical protein
MWANILLDKRFLIGVAVVSVVSFLYFRDSYQQSQIEKLSRTNDMLNLTIDEYKKVVEVLKKDVELVKIANKVMIDLNKKLSDEKKELEKTLFREREGKQSLGALAEKVPSKIQYRVNAATKKVFRCLEIASGDKYNESEKKVFSKCIPSAK